MAGFFDHLECPRCGWQGPPPASLCACGSPLLARYRIEEARGALRRETLAGRERSLWRYRELLPDVPSITLGEGGTPLVPARRLGEQVGLRRLSIKDEA